MLTDINGHYTLCDYNGYVRLILCNETIGYYLKTTMDLPFYLPNASFPGNGRTSCYWMHNTHPVNTREVLIDELATAELNTNHSLGLFCAPLQAYIIAGAHFLLDNTGNIDNMINLLKMINYS